MTEERLDTSKEAEAEASHEPADLVSGIAIPRRNFIDLLNEDLSWSTIHDILAYDINRPLNDNSTINMLEVARDEGWINEVQYEELRQEKNSAENKLATLMLERGMINEEQLREAAAFNRRTGQPMWRTFMQLKMVLPEQVVELLQKEIPVPFASRPDPELTEYLVGHKLATRAELDTAWKLANEQGIDFKDSLIKNQGLKPEQLSEVEAALSGFAFDPLTPLPEIPPPLLAMIPPPILFRVGAIPYKAEGDQLLVAFADPGNIRALDKLGLMLQMEMVPVLVPPKKLAELMSRYLSKDGTALHRPSETELESPATPAVEMLTVILRSLVRSGGTDIHIEPFRDATRVRYRVDGIIHDFISIRPDLSRRIIGRLKGMANMDVEKKHIPQDGHLNIRVDGAQRNFRITTVPCLDGEKVALRLVQSDMAFSAFEALGMNLKQQLVMNEMLNLPNGMILATGPVGGGKTTTLYSCLNSLDCFHHNIMTIEDPVEFEVAGVTQIQVNPQRKLTFDNGIRALLRQDPDMMMIGEIRDQETARGAIRAALTGTLVLSSMHANSAPSAVAALLQLGVNPYMVGNAVAAVVFQRLVRLICPDCRQEREADPHEKHFLEIDPNAPITLSFGKGCRHCLHTGYRGRIGVFELLEVNDAYRKVIYTNPSVDEMYHAAESAGLHSLYEHAKSLVLEGKTSIKEMMRIL